MEMLPTVVKADYLGDYLVAITFLMAPVRPLTSKIGLMVPFSSR